MNVVRHYHDVHLNNVPLLRGLSVTNSTDQPLREVESTLRNAISRAKRTVQLLFGAP